MKLTGKCKEDFSLWVVENEVRELFCEIYYAYDVDDFKELRTSVQFALVQEFADSKGIEIDVVSSGKGFIVFIEGVVFPKEYNTRKEAQEEAIKQFNINYNKNER